jgi:hypothetical protein
MRFFQHAFVCLLIFVVDTAAAPGHYAKPHYRLLSIDDKALPALLAAPLDPDSPDSTRKIVVTGGELRIQDKRSLEIDFDLQVSDCAVADGCIAQLDTARNTYSYTTEHGVAVAIVGGVSGPQGTSFMEARVDLSSDTVVMTFPVKRVYVNRQRADSVVIAHLRYAREGK